MDALQPSAGPMKKAGSLLVLAMIFAIHCAVPLSNVREESIRLDAILATNSCSSTDECVSIPAYGPGAIFMRSCRAYVNKSKVDAYYKLTESVNVKYTDNSTLIVDCFGAAVSVCSSGRCGACMTCVEDGGEIFP